MSPAGMSVYSPMCRYSSVMNDWQNRMTSASLRPCGSKSLPPLPPPMPSPVSAFLKICSKPRNLMMPRFTEGWKRRPPLYGPRALLNSTRKPRLTWTRPLSSVHGTRKMICRSGSISRSTRPGSAYSGRAASTGASVSSTSRAAWWNSGSAGLRRSISARIWSSDIFGSGREDTGVTGSLSGHGGRPGRGRMDTVTPCTGNRRGALGAVAARGTSAAPFVRQFRIRQVARPFQCYSCVSRIPRGATGMSAIWTPRTKYGRDAGRVSGRRRT